MRISDWSSDVCSSDLAERKVSPGPARGLRASRNTPLRHIGRLLRLLAIGLALLWSLAPVYWMLATSFKSELEATRLDPTLVPADPTLANYAGLAGSSLPFIAFFIKIGRAHV